MSFEFKVGDVVKIEGVVRTVSDKGYLVIETSNGYKHAPDIVDTQLVSRPKKKITKWRWVCEDNLGFLHVSLSKYESVEDFNKRIRGYKLLQKIDSTEKEFEVEG